MSPKFCSLAFDEAELEEQYTEKCFEPELTVLVKRQIENSSNDNIIQVTGRINVSF